MRTIHYTVQLQVELVMMENGIIEFYPSLLFKFIQFWVELTMTLIYKIYNFNSKFNFSSS